MFLSIFSFTGRVTRTIFWLGISPAMAFAIVQLVTFIHLIKPIPGPVASSIANFGVWLGNFFIDVMATPGSITSLLFSLSFLIVIILIPVIVTAKRLHDRNKSGWWQLLLYLPYILDLFLVIAPLLGLRQAIMRNILEPSSTTTFLLVFILLRLVSYGAMAWFLVELGFLGPRDPNKYGPDPRED